MWGKHIVIGVAAAAFAFGTVAALAPDQAGGTAVPAVMCMWDDTLPDYDALQSAMTCLGIPASPACVMHSPGQAALPCGVWSRPAGS